MCIRCNICNDTVSAHALCVGAKAVSVFSLQSSVSSNLARFFFNNNNNNNNKQNYGRDGTKGDEETSSTWQR